MLKENGKLFSEYKMSEGSKQNAFDLIEAIVEDEEGEVDNMEVLEEELELFYDCLGRGGGGELIFFLSTLEYICMLF